MAFYDIVFMWVFIQTNKGIRRNLMSETVNSKVDFKVIEGILQSFE